MMNAKGFFFFKFDSRSGLDAVLEGGPWMVHNSPIILKKWSMKTSLQKEELTHIPIWVKLHDVHIQVFEEDGISLIATYLGKPIMLDSYTSSMCKDSWGRSSFAQCLIKINSEADFMESITIGIPDLNRPGHTKETIRVEYEWKLPRCLTCNIFGHTGETCPKKVVTTPVVNDTNVTNDGFQKVVNRKRNNKGSSVGNKIPKGVPVSKGFQVGKEFAFQPKTSNVSSNQDTDKKKISNIASPNPFAALGVDDDEEEEVRQVVNENNLSVCVILESHVDVAAVYDTCKKVCSRWKWTSNGSLCSKGSQIILGWNDDLSNLVRHARLMRNRPWVLLGDFKAALNLKDHSAGGYEPNAAMREFKECVQDIEVADANSTGLHFTWNQKLKGSNDILKKIDRIMGNLQFNGDFPGSFAIFQPYRISDHSPSVLRIPKSVNIEGCAMFRFVKRLEGLKYPFCKLLHTHGNLHERVNKIRIKLDEDQKAIDRDPSSSILPYFHKIVKIKCARNMIEMVSDASNNLYDGVLDDGKADYMVHDVSNDEVKSVIFSMGGDRAPGPDGFTVAFFKKACDVVGEDITCVVRDFFSNGKLLKEYNHTIISLIPKIIANRIKEGLSDIVSINQSVVPGRMISDNILLT
ncbi:putative reverse transcriptase domain-containing protein [Tanacetum coccineum]